MKLKASKPTAAPRPAAPLDPTDPKARLVIKKDHPEATPPAPAQPQPENPLDPAVVARMKNADFLPGQMIVATQDILQLIALIKIYATEVERLRGLLPPAKA